jgi:hypothetical protein
MVAFYNVCSSGIRAVLTLVGIVCIVRTIPVRVGQEGQVVRNLVNASAVGRIAADGARIIPIAASGTGGLLHGDPSVIMAAALYIFCGGVTAVSAFIGVVTIVQAVAVRVGHKNRYIVRNLIDVGAVGRVAADGALVIPVPASSTGGLLHGDPGVVMAASLDILLYGVRTPLASVDIIAIVLTVAVHMGLINRSRMRHSCDRCTVGYASTGTFVIPAPLRFTGGVYDSDP